jgi:hypothetical protein
MPQKIAERWVAIDGLAAMRTETKADRDARKTLLAARRTVNAQQ